MGKPKNLRWVLIMVCLLWPFTPQAAEFPWQAGGTSPILLEDNFDSENWGRGEVNYSRFENWEVTEGTVDLLGHGFHDSYPAHGMYLDLDGSTYRAGRLRSKSRFRLEPGRYRLEFDLAGNPVRGRNRVTVRLGRVFNEDFVLGPNEPFTTITRDITVSAPSRARLVFEHSGGDNMGLLLDNVKLKKLAGGEIPPRAGIDPEEQRLLDALKRYFEAH